MYGHRQHHRGADQADLAQRRYPRCVGKLGIDGTDTYAFDIGNRCKRAPTPHGWCRGPMLYTVSLETGAVDKSWELSGTDGATMRDITFMTAM